MMFPKKDKEVRAKEKKARKKVKKKSVKKISLKKEKEKADKIMSIYIRLRDCLKTTNTTELGKCYTCGNTFHFDDLQNGHFESRRFNSTRFDENDCRIQCYSCNVCLNGNYIEYTKRLINEIGQDGVNRLHDKARTNKRFKAVDMLEIQQYFIGKIKDLANLRYEWKRVEGKSHYKWQVVND